MAFSDKQRAYFAEATARWNIKCGATRSGKTYMDYFVIPKRIRAIQGDGLVVFIGNTQATLERNIFDPLRQIWGGALVGEVRNQNKIRLFGRECYALGADKRSSVTKLQGAGIAYAYGDEITTWAEPVFQMLKSRLDKPHSVFDGTCNPDNPNHWFKAFLDSGADIYQAHFTIDDNPFLSPAFVANLKQEYAGTVYYQRYIDGLWVRAEGLIYDGFSEAAHVVNDPGSYARYYVGVDYGTQNPTVFLLMGKTETRWEIIDEYYYSGRTTKRQKTDRAYADDFLTFIADRPISGTVVDPSAASFIAELRSRGIAVTPAKNEVLSGIRKTASMLGEGTLVVHERCRHTIDEFNAYSWDERACALGEDRPLKEHDHAMDALRYLVNTVCTGSRARAGRKALLGL